MAVLNHRDSEQRLTRPVGEEVNQRSVRKPTEKREYRTMRLEA